MEDNMENNLEETKVSGRSITSSYVLASGEDEQGIFTIEIPSDVNKVRLNAYAGCHHHVYDIVSGINVIKASGTELYSDGTILDVIPGSTLTISPWYDIDFIDDWDMDTRQTYWSVSAIKEEGTPSTPEEMVKVSASFYVVRHDGKDYIVANNMTASTKSETKKYKPGTYTLIVPDDTISVTFTLSGGGGGSISDWDPNSDSGGDMDGSND